MFSYYTIYIFEGIFISLESISSRPRRLKWNCKLTTDIEVKSSSCYIAILVSWYEILLAANCCTPRLIKFLSFRKYLDKIQSRSRVKLTNSEQASSFNFFYGGCLELMSGAGMRRVEIVKWRK